MMPRPFSVLLLLGFALAHGGHYLPASGPGAKDFSPPKPLPSVALLDGLGKPAVFPAPGPAAVYFGYTRCPDACPLTLGRLVPAYEALGSPPALRLWMLSVDPGRDTPAALSQYLRGFAPVAGLTAQPEGLRRLADAVGLEYNRAPGGRLVFHTDALALLDSQGRVARILYGVSRLSVSQLKSELAKVVR